MTKLVIWEKSTENTKGGCSWLLNLVNKSQEVIENVDTAYAISRWILDRPISGYFNIPQKIAKKINYGKTKSKTELLSYSQGWLLIFTLSPLLVENFVLFIEPFQLVNAFNVILLEIISLMRTESWGWFVATFPVTPRIENNHSPHPVVCLMSRSPSSQQASLMVSGSR